MNTKKILIFITALFLLLSHQSISHGVEGETPSYGDINRTKAVRIRSLDGSVLVKTSPDGEWIQAHEYMILTDGYSVSTGPGAFAEIELDSKRFIRLREDSEMSVSDLNSHTAVFGHISGGLYVSALENRMRGIVVDLGAGRRAVFFGQGAFRIDEDHYDGVNVTVREGRITVEHEGGKLDVHEGEMARINGRISLERARGKDSWDDFVQRRDNETLALAGEPYIYEEIPGRYETYGYSEWVAYPAYGYFWWPHVSLVFFGHHGHYGHLHRSGIHIGFGHHIHRRHHIIKRHYLHRRRHLHKNHLHGAHRAHKGRHLHRRHRRHDKRLHTRHGNRKHKRHDIHRTRIFKRNHVRRGRQSNYGKPHFKNRRGNSHLKGKISHRGKRFNNRRAISRGKSFRSREGRKSMMRGGRGGFRGGRGRR